VVNFASRYFLRHLAQARRDPNNADDSVPYNKALLETALLFVIMPATAVVSIVGSAGLRYFPNLLKRAFGVAPFYFLVGVVAISMSAGYLWFRRRFKGYRHNPNACAEFDSDRDREIIFWQKYGTIVVCVAVIPLLALLVFLA